MEFPDSDPFLYELINGILVRRSAPSGEHQHVQSELFYQLMHFVSQKKLGRVYSSPTSAILSEEDAPQPDLIYLSKEKMNLFDPERGIRGAPDMVVEIILPSSYKRDHYDKKELYQKYGIPEYWIVDPSNHSIEILVLKNNEYVLHAFGIDGEKIASHIVEGFTLEVESVFLKK